ncbi:hypothetical protein EVAR_15095_1 [Eumeta japonica]|uniref:PiggyBac transposable element-derived protein domain-containing protein n=1 Tax=Eumeta variegata TaxID=151549 RepID=A0A4C1UHW6_EUMVA|nr:hypothetical protein EVAR_15095_1 [Eumeta japonica]
MMPNIVSLPPGDSGIYQVIRSYHPAASVRLMKAAMDVDHEKLLSDNLLKMPTLSNNDKQPLPNAKSSKQPLAASYQSLTNSEEKKNNNGKSVNDCDERAEAESSRVRSKRCPSPALARYLKCPGFYRMGTVRLTRKNIPEDVKKMKKNREKGTIIARHSGDVIMALA